MKLHTYGLLRDSFRLQDKMEGVRTIWRLRDRHVKDASRAVQHMQKALTKMNIQLANVISDISGVSGQAIIGAILKGERDPWKLAEMKHDMVRASQEEVARSLEGNWREDLVFELRQAVDSFHFAHQQMQQCDRQLESFLASLPTRTLEIPSDRATAAVTQTVKKERKAKRPTRK
jgi:DNA-binding protein YbaB